MPYIGSLDANTRMRVRAAIVLQLKDVIPDLKLETNRYAAIDVFASEATVDSSNDPMSIRDFDASNITDSKGVNIGPVPSRLIGMISGFTQDELKKAGIYRVPGNQATVKELKKKNVTAFGTVTVEDRASVTKDWARNIVGGVIHLDSIDTFAKIFDAYQSDVPVMAEKIIKTILLLPVPNINTLRYICLHLSEVSKYSETNKMDLPNLATCWGPTLYPFNDNATPESFGAIKKYTATVVEMIRLADTIGMVSGDLLEAAKAPAVDGVLCQIGETDPEPTYIMPKKSKSKTKSVRAAILSSLSESISKWKKPGLSINTSNISDKSSFIHDQTDASMYCEDVRSTDNILKDLKSIDSTPVVLRKRKANEEVIPFSASKKQAILQNMPQMSALGTPFTPVARKPPKSDYYDTPSIQFAEDSDMIFAATPGHQTPRSKLFSSQSATKVKRPSPGKQNSFSPKPQKSTRKGSFRKFLRRLSGSKEGGQPQQSPNNCSIDSSDSVASFGNTSGQKKKGTSFFRRRKKTPSSPARLVTSLPLELPRKDSKTSINSFLSSTEHAIDMDKLESKELAAKLKRDLVPDHEAKTFSIPNRRRSADGAVVGNTSLKRGKPNTVQSGLPFDSLLGGSPNHSVSTRNTIQKSSSHKEIFMSPERCERFECDPGAFDTSPIEKVETIDNCDVGLRKGGFDRQVSTASMNFDYSMALADQAVIMDDHEGSYLHDTSEVHENETEKSENETENPDTEGTSGTVQSKSDTQEQVASNQESGEKHPATLDDQVQIPQKEFTKEMMEELGPIPFCDEGSTSYAMNPEVSTCSVQESETITLRKRTGNTKRRCSAEPNLHVSADVHQILFNAGVVGEETDKSTSSFVAVSTAPTHVKAFIMPDNQLQKPDLAAQKEIIDRKASPLRFPNAAMRRGGASPVRIPTIFAKADREASKYRDLAKNIAKDIPRSNATKPSIPISTSLLRNMSVETGKKRVEALRQTREGSTAKENPKSFRQPVLSSMQTNLEKSAKQDEKLPLKPQNVDLKMSDLLERKGPIRPQNLSKGLNTKLSEMSRDKIIRHKGPMKPVKRLQGSPKSPKSPSRFHTSPNSTKKPGRLSPIPTHITDWNI